MDITDTQREFHTTLLDIAKRCNIPLTPEYVSIIANELQKNFNITLKKIRKGRKAQKEPIEKTEKKTKKIQKLEKIQDTTEDSEMEILSGYKLFVSDTSQIIKEREGTKDLMKKINAEWRKLTPEEKDEWKNKSAPRKKKKAKSKRNEPQQDETINPSAIKTHKTTVEVIEETSNSSSNISKLDSDIIVDDGPNSLLELNSSKNDLDQIIELCNDGTEKIIMDMSDI